MKTSLILAGLTAAGSTQLHPLMRWFGFGMALILVLIGFLVYDVTRSSWSVARAEPRLARARMALRSVAGRVRAAVAATRDTNWLDVTLTLLARLMLAAEGAWDAHLRWKWQPEDWRPGELRAFLADDYEEPWSPVPAAAWPGPFIDGTLVAQADAPVERVLATAGAR